jgi:electron transport complex protein RnfC
MLSFFSKPLIRGGVHADEHKAATAALPIAYNFPLPKKLYIPLQQHVGKPAEPLIMVGEKVLKGQLLAYSQGLISAPVHAPSSGVILDVNDYPAPHPSAADSYDRAGNRRYDEWMKTHFADLQLTPEDIVCASVQRASGPGRSNFPRRRAQYGAEPY